MDEAATHFEQRPFGEARMVIFTLPKGQVTVGEDVRGPRADLVEFRLLVALQSPEITINSVKYRLRRGDMILMDLSRPIVAECSAAKHWMGLSIPRTMMFDRIAGASGLPPIYISREIPVASLFVSCLFRLWRTGGGLKSGNAVSVAETQLDLLMEAARRSVEAGSGEMHRVSKIFMISRMIRQRLGELDFSLGRLLSGSGMSRHTFYDLIGATSARHLVCRYRLFAARRLLHSATSNTLSVTEIARRVGFKSLAYFSKTYTDEFRISPSRERAMMATSAS